MTPHLLSRSGACAFVLAAGLGSAGLVSNAAAQSVDASPTVPPALSPPQGSPAVNPPPAPSDPTLATSPAEHPAAKDRHLAPPGTFYLLSYVSVTTNDGVEGFEPGQEVRLVEARHATHTLVVTDGHAQVEVPPSKLTNDLDVAAAVRQKDEANQARVAAYIKAEQAASARYERAAADYTARDLAQRQQEQAAEAQPAAPPPAEPSTPSANETVAADDGAVSADSGYYGYGGYGYGSPYSYLVIQPSAYTARRAPAATTAAAPAALPGRVAEPTGGRAGGGGRPK